MKSNRLAERYTSVMEQRLNNEMTRRALGRRDWKVCKFRLGDEPSENLASTTTAEEASANDVASRGRGLVAKWSPHARLRAQRHTH